MSNRVAQDAEWARLLVAARAGARDAHMEIAQRVGLQLADAGAYRVRDDWTHSIQELVRRVVEMEPGAPDLAKNVQRRIKRVFWTEVLDGFCAGNARAADHAIFPTMRHLLSSWDRSRAHEASWDDVIQDATSQLWKRWREGDVREPWGLLYTIVRRRFLDRVRSATPDIPDPEEVPDPVSADEGFFTREALDQLSEEEREIISLIDLEGGTRREVATTLGRSEGEVLSRRRAGLRKLWRWLGKDLPDEEKRVWELLFVGSRRVSTDQVARRLGVSEETVRGQLATARERLGLAA